MINRYEIQEISKIWTEKSRFYYFLKVETSLLKETLNELEINHDNISKIDDAKIDIDRIKEIEKTVQHDVVAFCSSITEQFPEDKIIQKLFHFGVTSSDIIDTAISLQIKDSLQITLNYLDSFLKSLKNKCVEHKNDLCLGRSHGMYAEPMSLGQKLLGHYTEIHRRKIDLESFLLNDLTGMISGAIGNYTLVNKSLEKKVLTSLGLKNEPVSTQVIPRDRYVKLTQIITLLASGLERFAIEIRHLHRSEIKEFSEGFVKGQKGSSTMPHKKNPISSENITGISRVIKSYSQIALENNTLWHERDISHSSAERIYLPDMFGLICYSLKRFDSTIENLVVHKGKMLERVKENKEYLSSFILHFLLKETSLTRDQLYPIVQETNFYDNFSDPLINCLIKLDKDLDKDSFKNKIKEITNWNEKDLLNYYASEVNNQFETFL
jgi:adenylosuccinate lyase